MAWSGKNWRKMFNIGFYRPSALHKADFRRTNPHTLKTSPRSSKSMTLHHWGHLWASYLKFDMQHDHVLKKFNFGLLNPSRGSWGRGVCGQDFCYHVAASLILLNLICIWPCSEKVEFWTTDPIPRVWGGVFGQNICYHVATFLFLILYNLICNMTVLWFHLLTQPPKSTQGVRQAFNRKSRLICFIFIVPLSTSKISVKTLTTLWVIVKF